MAEEVTDDRPYEPGTPAHYAYLIAAGFDPAAAEEIVAVEAGDVDLVMVENDRAEPSTGEARN